MPDGTVWPFDSCTVVPVFFTTLLVVCPSALVNVAVERPPAGPVLSVSSAPGYAVEVCHCCCPWCCTPWW